MLPASRKQASSSFVTGVHLFVDMVSPYAAGERQHAHLTPLSARDAFLRQMRMREGCGACARAKDENKRDENL